MRRTVSGRASSAPLHEVDIRPQRVGPKRVVEVRGGHLHRKSHTHLRGLFTAAEIYVRWGMDGWWETQRVGVKSDHRNVEADLESFSFRMPGVRPHTAHKGGVCEDRSQQKRVEVGLEWRGDLNLSAHFSCR